MKPFVEAMTDSNLRGFKTGRDMIEFFLVDRDRRFKPGNDKTWGPGNWVRCMLPGWHRYAGLSKLSPQRVS